MATSCWPAMVRTGALTEVSVMSVEVTAAASAVCTPVAVPVDTFGTLIESVPDGRVKPRTALAIGRPKRGSSMYWSTSHSGGTK